MCWWVPSPQRRTGSNRDTTFTLTRGTERKTRHPCGVCSGAIAAWRIVYVSYIYIYGMVRACATRPLAVRHTCIRVGRHGMGETAQKHDNSINEYIILDNSALLRLLAALSRACIIHLYIYKTLYTCIYSSSILLRIYVPYTTRPLLSYVYCCTYTAVLRMILLLLLLLCIDMILSVWYICVHVHSSHSPVLQQLYLFDRFARGAVHGAGQIQIYMYAFLDQTCGVETYYASIYHISTAAVVVETKVKVRRLISYCRNTKQQYLRLRLLLQYIRVWCIYTAIQSSTYSSSVCCCVEHAYIILLLNRSTEAGRGITGSGGNKPQPALFTFPQPINKHRTTTNGTNQRAHRSRNKMQQ